MLSDFDKAIRAGGSRFDPEWIPQSLSLAAGLFADEPKGDAVVTRDHEYGDHARHRLDLYRPPSADGSLPVIVYVHGGGFIQGDKNLPDSPFYETLGEWIAGAGFVGAIMTYRLAPENKWPSGAQDIAAAVVWLRSNAKEFGIDADKIVVIGQSAGGAHTAGYMAGHGGSAPEVAAAVILSGIYDLRVGGRSPMDAMYYGDDPGRDEEQSATEALISSDVPLFIGITEYDPPSFQEQYLDLVGKYYARNQRLPALGYAVGHNHFTGLLHIGSEDTAYGDSILKFIRLALA